MTAIRKKYGGLKVRIVQNHYGFRWTLVNHVGITVAQQSKYSSSAHAAHQALRYLQCALIWGGAELEPFTPPQGSKQHDLFD